MVEILKEKIKLLEGFLEAKEADRRGQVDELQDKIAKLTERLVEEREKNQRIQSYQSQVELTKLEAKRIVQEKNKELEGLRRFCALK